MPSGKNAVTMQISPVEALRKFLGDTDWIARTGHVANRIGDADILYSRFGKSKTL